MLGLTGVRTLVTVIVIGGALGLLKADMFDGDHDPDRARAAYPAHGMRVTPVTGRQSELRRGRVRVRVVAHRAVTARLRAFLRAGRDTHLLPASGTRHVPLRAGRSALVKLRLTDAGRLAAASCVPLRLVVQARSGRRGDRASRSLRTGGRRCSRRPSERLPRRGTRYTAASTPPVDPNQLTSVPFGTRSHWVAPWKAWLDTPPARRLLAAPGINFNVEPAEAGATAKLLAARGIRRARVEIGWNAMSYDDPSRLANAERARTILGALREAGIRPLVLLNANHQEPGPVRQERLLLRSPARVGARTVTLEAATATRVVPGLTGFDRIDSDRGPDVLITDVGANGVARLARPLPRPLAAGAYEGTTLRYGPFQRPQLPGGSPNPAFERTLEGWLRYAHAVVGFVHETLGGWDFDVEIWNELTFGADFLDSAAYYDPAPRGEGDVTSTILARTVASLRDPGRGIGPIGISDGFASQTPFAAGSTSPPGLTALSKHPYVSIRRFPADAGRHPDQPSVNATGNPGRTDFVPSYTAYFPEYWLTAIQTETLLRDLAPTATEFAGAVHGRTSAPPGGHPPTMWLTEFNLVPPDLDATRPGPEGDRAREELTVARTKGVLRALVAHVNKGVQAIDFYAAMGNDYGLVPAREPLDALGRMMGALSGARAQVRPRPLQLVRVADVEGRREFDGDGTGTHPPLYDRDTFAAFPFQLSDRAWAVAVYVMTRDVRRDLPAAPFRLTLEGVRSRTARASLYDPSSGRFVPTRVSSRSGRRIAVDVRATDSPRLLFVSE